MVFGIDGVKQLKEVIGYGGLPDSGTDALSFSNFFHEDDEVWILADAETRAEQAVKSQNQSMIVKNTSLCHG